MSKQATTMAAAIVIALAAPVGASAAVTEINEFVSPVPAVPTPGVWYETDIRNGGTASIPDLTGQGGNLENNQPLPTGAALLTTRLNENNDKAEVGTFADFGLASTVLTDVDLAYSYYKQTVAGGNQFAAPSLKLTVFAMGGTGDNFGQLIYEPTWNQPGGGSAVVPADAWQNVVIDQDTGGGGDDSTGGWWWTGGFEVGNSFGGPPIRSLAEWAAALAAGDPADFPNARIVGLSMGIGTFNQGNTGYFDDVNITVGTAETTTFDFEAASVPEPASLALLAAGLVGLGWRRRT